MRDDRAPRLADAQRAVATDLGFASWPALVGHAEAARGDREQRRARLVSEVAADEVTILLAEAGDRTGIVRETGLACVSGYPVRVRRRGVRYDIDDMGRAVAVAGRPSGWLEAAERAVEALGWNVNR